MDVWIHRYTLVPRRRLSGVAAPGARAGALLRVGDGFADVHPWPELGDAPLDEQLSLLARGETTALTSASLHLLSADATARARGVSLFDDLTIPLSHWPGADPPTAFDTVKIKDVSAMPADVRLRIDFNATLSPSAFVEIANRLPRDRVDFVEDPCPYDLDVWRELRETTGLRLAFDQKGTPRGGYDVAIWKPALQPTRPDAESIVVTSYMDHPVGQFGAAWVAAVHAERVDRRCGLMTHVLYEPNEFIEAIRTDGARLLPPPGTGIGFDDLLERLPWKRLA
jgi:o-succinylbenzoate synthase